MEVDRFFLRVFFDCFDGTNETVLLVYGLFKHDVETDMYNPTGCWNPTFKASYNDIECKVQVAVKHIIKMLSKQEPLSDFYITEDDLNLKINKL